MVVVNVLNSLYLVVKVKQDDVGARDSNVFNQEFNQGLPLCILVGIFLSVHDRLQRQILLRN